MYVYLLWIYISVYVGHYLPVFWDFLVLPLALISPCKPQKSLSFRKTLLPTLRICTSVFSPAEYHIQLKKIIYMDGRIQKPSL